MVVPCLANWCLRKAALAFSLSLSPPWYVVRLVPIILFLQVPSPHPQSKFVRTWGGGGGRKKSHVCQTWWSKREIHVETAHGVHTLTHFSRPLETSIDLYWTWFEVHGGGRGGGGRGKKKKKLGNPSVQQLFSSFAPSLFFDTMVVLFLSFPSPPLFFFFLHAQSLFFTSVADVTRESQGQLPYSL